MCISGSLLKERVDKTLSPLLEKERLGEVLPDHTKLHSHLHSQLRRGLIGDHFIEGGAV